MHEDARWMTQALDLARQAAAVGEVPIGSVIVGPDSQILGRGFNRRILDNDPTAHAEIVAIRQAGQALRDWRLEGCTLYVTLEPCPMCAGAMINARLPRLVYGCDDPKAGAVRSLFRLCEDPRLNHRLEVSSGILAQQCADVLREFFKAQRALGKK